MPRSPWLKFALLVVVLTVAIHACAAADVLATNKLPNPYRPIENWAQLPAGMQ